ncbi:MAG: hypothetical protein ACPGWR_25190, partial [Ardenticatenaceae bacterium]
VGYLSCLFGRALVQRSRILILPTRQGNWKALSDTYPAYSAGHLSSEVGEKRLSALSRLKWMAQRAAQSPHFLP